MIGTDIFPAGRNAGKAVLFLCFFIFSSYQDISAGNGLPEKYRPLKVSEGIAQDPGRVSWHPDSNRLAYVAGAVHIYDMQTKEQRTVHVDSPYYAAWGKGDDLFILYREDGSKALCRVDGRGQGLKKISLAIEPDAVFPVKDGSQLLLLSVRVFARALWTDYHYGLYLYDLRTGSTKKIHEATNNLSLRKLRPEDLKGLIQPSMNPFDATALVLESVRPPNAPSYLKIMHLDYITGKAEAVGRLNSKSLSVPFSSSPDGRRFAFTDESGRLKIYDHNGGVSDSGFDIQGRLPAWNPAGSQIYFGGYVVGSSAGGEPELLLPGGAASLAVWSPDGRKMALVTGDGLWLLDNFIPSFLPPDRVPDRSLSDKIVLLKELLAEGLITDRDYRERYEKLVKGRRGP
ncbi:MAG: hypothetical protein EPN25_08905 [Nitrospirae bacterium]|nr:MAG: hypothetical protein EPN25_08905 [Nitrospirota bacterium]